MRLTWLADGLRILRISLNKKIVGIPRYPGTAEDICHSIVERCWNLKHSYFQVSAGHFYEFYTRDFAWCTKALINLGYEDRVHSTLKYALERFSNKSMITAVISPRGTPFDFPSYAVDSVPYLIHSIVACKGDDLVEEHRTLLEEELCRFVQLVVEKKTGLVRKDVLFSSAKDHFLRQSSCYDNVMLGMLSADLDDIGLDNPLKKYDYQELLRSHFWNGKSFKDDLSGQDIISGDANVFPYWTGVFRTKSMMWDSVRSMKKLRLDTPIPLKYTAVDTEQPKVFADRFTPNYEGTTIWSYLGLLYIEVVSRVDKKLARQYLDQYREIIERYGNFLEVLNPDCSPYSSGFYVTDDSMLWAALYSDLVRRLRI